MRHEKEIEHQAISDQNDNPEMQEIFGSVLPWPVRRGWLVSCVVFLGLLVSMGSISYPEVVSLPARLVPDISDGMVAETDIPAWLLGSLSVGQLVQVRITPSMAGQETYIEGRMTEIYAGVQGAHPAMYVGRVTLSREDSVYVRNASQGNGSVSMCFDGPDVNLLRRAMRSLKKKA